MPDQDTNLHQDWSNDHPRGLSYECDEPHADVDLRMKALDPGGFLIQILELCEKHTS